MHFGKYSQRPAAVIVSLLLILLGSLSPAVSATETFYDNLQVTNLEGHSVDLGQHKGGLVLINFWATWCPPCKKEIPDFIELQKDYSDQDFQIIGIAIDDEQAVQEYVTEIGMNYPNMVVESEGVGLAKRYGNGIGALPYTVIINRNGEISHTIMGELSKMRAKELLEEHGINL